MVQSQIRNVFSLIFIYKLTVCLSHPAEMHDSVALARNSFVEHNLSITRGDTIGGGNGGAMSPYHTYKIGGPSSFILLGSKLLLCSHFDLPKLFASIRTL